jgi:ADP-dependent NAD(P)H-hydrate dehydratase / NAD(P)H-hydrate epimerase
MLLLAGTLPIPDMPLTFGACKYGDSKLTIGDYTLTDNYVTLGSAAMISASCATCQALGIEGPHAVVAGDIGSGDGTLKMFRFVTDEVSRLKPKVLTMHYILPARDPFIELVGAVDKTIPKPFFIADAGTMLNAKAVGLSKKFDLFTPDPGELSFLADPDAAHPAYVRHFIFEVDNTEVARLGKEAFEHGDTPRYLLVKSATDHILVDGKVVGVVKEPNIPALEPIGGTGDTITGIVSALIHSGLEPSDACLKAARINRVMGQLANPTPATRISQLIPFIPEAVKRVIP